MALSRWGRPERMVGYEDRSDMRETKCTEGGRTTHLPLGRTQAPGLWAEACSRGRCKGSGVAVSGSVTWRLMYLLDSIAPPGPQEVSHKITTPCVDVIY